MLAVPVLPFPPPLEHGDRHGASQDERGNGEDQYRRIHYLSLLLQQSHRNPRVHAWQHTTHRRMPKLMVWKSAGTVMVFMIIPVIDGTWYRNRTCHPEGTLLQSAQHDQCNTRRVSNEYADPDNIVP